MKFEPRYPDCKKCVNWTPSRISKICLACTAGEFFEENFEEQTCDRQRFTDYRNDD